MFQRAGIVSFCCRDMAEACLQLGHGAAALLLAEEVLGQESQDGLLDLIDRQAPWSDLPILVLARPGADSAAVARAMDLLGNVTVLERPTRIAALVSAARSALRARQRQYQTREHLAERELTEATLRVNDRRKDEFLAILAHELRNPLAPICNALHIFRLRGEDDPATLQIAAMLERQVGHLVRLVDDLLEVSRITRGKIELRRQRVDLADVIRTAVETSRPLIEAGGHRLSVTAPQAPMAVDADPVRLAQVFSNLLNNAAKYTDREGLIRLEVRVEGEQLVVAVRDSGTGIPPEMLARVFDMFTQVDGASLRSQGGLGIGLTLVKSIVELHGGTVHAASEGPGKGSEFVVRLPLSCHALAEGAFRRDAERV